VAHMRFALYALYSAIGGLAWAAGLVLVGYWLGQFQFVEDNKGYIDYVVLGVVLLGLIPIGLHLVQSRRRRT
jgi:membrane-associated protein